MNLIPLPLRGGSGKNQLKRGPQIKYKELSRISFLDPPIGHGLIVKAQNRNLDKVELWLKNYPDGISFDQNN